MLVANPRRQFTFPSSEHLPSPSPSHSSLTFFDGLPVTACTPSPSDFNGRPTPGCFQPSAAKFDSADSQYMSGIFNQNPAIRIEQSAPTPAHPMSTGYPQHSDNNAYTWGEGNNQMVATGIPSLQTPFFSRKSRSHQRAQSSSSIGSSGSSSPYSLGHAISFHGIKESSTTGSTASSKISHSYGLDGSVTFGNHLPTPTQTPTQDSFMSNSYPNNHNFQQSQNLEPATAASVAMSRSMIDHQIGEDDVPGMSHSGRHSVSSMGQEPSTPHTISGDAYEAGFKIPSTGETHFKVEDWFDKYLQYDDEQDALPSHNIPKLDHTMTDSYADEGYYPTTTSAPMPAPTQKVPQNPIFLSPRQSQVKEFLQAAQIARSQSPTSTISRDISPFRTNSPWAQSVRLQSAAQTRENQQATSLRNELRQHMSPQETNTPKTISPKDAVLEYREEDEESKMPLFPDAGSFGQQYGAQTDPSTMQGQYNPGTQSLRTMSASGAGNWPSGASRQPPTANFPSGPMPSTQQHSAFNFAMPSGIPYQQSVALPFSTQNYRATSTMPVTKHEETPDFPAHLTSMDSSASEAPSTNANAAITADAQRPATTLTLADTGTYTCTYHGCSLRFETPQKLQRHKRDGHRQVAAQQQHTPGLGSGMTSVALAARNSQAGPHKCERINPTTGKPCNTVFSRPYDLTRHEDTIHNARKQKVRCALCVEEKTFSRNDALTRHMRVVHPEVDFPGKHRRRSSHD